MKTSDFMMAVVLTLIFAIYMVGPSSACDAMGPDRHLGVVQKINPERGTFTIIDAQMRKPLTFIADQETLNTLALDQPFVITYRMDGSKMKAESVEKAQ
jgi:hypothetical protein